jgi:hypothetical protein
MVLGEVSRGASPPRAAPSSAAPGDRRPAVGTPGWPPRPLGALPGGGGTPGETSLSTINHIHSLTIFTHQLCLMSGWGGLRAGHPGPQGPSGPGSGHARELRRRPPRRPLSSLTSSLTSLLLSGVSQTQLMSEHSLRVTVFPRLQGFALSGPGPGSEAQLMDAYS